MDYFATFRYFEEFEKRIPRAEMEKMEVMKYLHFSVIKFVLFFCSYNYGVCLDSYHWRAKGDQHRIYWNNLWKLQER